MDNYNLFEYEIWNKTEKNGTLYRYDCKDGLNKKTNFCIDHNCKIWSQVLTVLQVQ